jgi:hypothetical protein
MILIDKAKASQSIILTLSELSSIESPKYLMVIKSDAFRTSITIPLPENESPFKSRFDLFNISTSEFSSLVSGYYIYSVFEFSQDADLEVGEFDKAIESGKMLVRGIIEQVEIISPKRNDDYLIY